MGSVQPASLMASPPIYTRPFVKTSRNANFKQLVNCTQNHRLEFRLAFLKLVFVAAIQTMFLQGTRHLCRHGTYHGAQISWNTDF